MTPIQHFQVTLARLVEAPHLPTRLVLSFQWPEALGLEPDFAPEQTSLDVDASGLVLCVSGRGYLVFLLEPDAAAPKPETSKTTSDVDVQEPDDGPRDRTTHQGTPAPAMMSLTDPQAQADEHMGRDAFLRAFAQRRSLTLVAFDAQGKSVLALEFNL